MEQEPTPAAAPPKRRMRRKNAAWTQSWAAPESDARKRVREWCRAHGVSDRLPIHPLYNLVGVPDTWPRQMVEGIAFGKAWPSELGGLGGFGHLKNFVQLTWPWVEWNPWLERCFRSLTEPEYETIIGQTRLRFVNWTGPGSAGKTAAAGIFACAWFLYDFCAHKDPRTSVTLTSTSKGIIAQRVWPVIQRCFHEARNADDLENKLEWGHMIDSSKIVMGLRQDGTKDAKNSICAMAVESGELTKAVDKIKGRHSERMLLVVDEANSTPQAIFECIPNMLTSVKELIVLVIGNAISRLDAHGLCCQPAAGWKSITIEEDEWETKGVQKWGISKGVCVHFDGAKSPNVVAGRTLYKHIYSMERWQHVESMGDEYRNTIQHWSQDRGFWPPDNIQTTVFSENTIISHDGMGDTTPWLSMPRPCAALDPAFGGDNCVLQFGLIGDVPGNKMSLQLTDTVLVPFEPDSPDAIDAQIARYVVGKCQERKVAPHLFGCDSTGTGRGVAAFIQQMWSPRIATVEFGGAASDRPASRQDPRCSNEIYGNRVSELWYAALDVLCGDQLKGMCHQAVLEACSRFYKYENRRYKVESKDDMKKRLGYSPDYMDSVAVLVEVGRRNGLIATASFARKQQDRDQEEATHLLQAVVNDDYSQQPDFSAYAEVEY